MSGSGSAGYIVSDALKEVIGPDGRAYRVPPTAFAVLKYLHRNRGRVCSASEIMYNVWDRSVVKSDRATLVRLAVRTLRERIAPDVVDTISLYGYGVDMNGDGSCPGI